MREINLNGKQYKIKGEVTKRAISPWMAKISSGSREYSDFSQAQLEEYHDFRNGIGLESDLPSESNRTWFTEGIDFTSPRSAVLGPLVTTAGSFGVAPVKIIDFENNTYAIGNGKISKWSGSAWVLEGLLVEDCEDIWVDAGGIGGTVSLDTTIKVVGGASARFVSNDAATGLIMYEDITSIDLSGYTEINLWFRSGTTWSAGDFQLVLDDSPGSGSPVETIDFPAYTSATAWQAIKLTLANPGSDTAIVSVGIKNTVSINGQNINIDQVVADGYIASPVDAIVITDTTDTYLVVSSAEMATYYDGTTWKYMIQLNGCRGYLAFYDTKLRSIDTDGLTLRSSPANDIDGSWTKFSLTGQFGTVYDLFEGKLLADGTPTLYFCGTEGLYTIDTANEIAYQQEVQYPPLTYSGHKGMYWNANVWVATGFGILKVTPGLATFIGPDQDDGLPSGKQGFIYDMVTVNNWLVYCVNGGSETETLRPNATGDETSLTDEPSAGDNYDKVDEASADDISTYVFTAETASFVRDLYHLPASSGSGTINFIKIYFRCAASATGGVGAKPSLKSNSTVTDGTEVFPSGVIFQTYSEQWNTNPADGEAWEWADIDALQIGISLKGVGGRTSRCTQVYVEVDYGAKSSILKRSASVGGNLQVYTTSATSKPIACLHHSPSSLYTNGRLWFGEGTDVKYMMFPDTTSNVKQIPDYEYVDDSGYGKFPIFRKLAAITKVALGVAAITKSCDSNEFIQVFYGLNGAAPTTSLGTFITSPRPTKLLFNSGLGTEFYTIQFSIKLFRATANTTNSPELESLLFYYMPRPETINAWTFNVECIEDNAEALITAFEAIRDTKVLVPFYPTGDTAKNVFNVALTTMPMKFYVENQQTRQGVISVTTEEVFNG